MNFMSGIFLFQKADSDVVHFKNVQKVNLLMIVFDYQKIVLHVFIQLVNQK